MEAETKRPSCFTKGVQPGALWWKPHTSDGQKPWAGLPEMHQGFHPLATDEKWDNRQFCKEVFWNRNFRCLASHCFILSLLIPVTSCWYLLSAVHPQRLLHIYWYRIQSYICTLLHCSVVCDSLRPHGLQPTRLLCPWDFPGKNTGVGSYSLLQGILPAQGANLGLLHCRQILYHLCHIIREVLIIYTFAYIHIKYLWHWNFIWGSN